MRWAAAGAVVTMILLVSFMANAETITWNGYSWDVTGATASVDGAGYLNLSADGTFHSHTGKITGAVGLRETDYFSSGEVDSFSASYIDSGDSNQSTWAVVKMAYQDGTAGFLSIGNALNSTNYVAVWGFREAITGDAPWTATWSLLLGARSAGLHTSKFVKNADGSTQLWFDDALVVEQSQVTMSAFEIMNLVNQNELGGDSTSVFTDVQVSASATPEPASMLLFGSAMAGLAAYRVRRSKLAKPDQA